MRAYTEWLALVTLPCLLLTSACGEKESQDADTADYSYYACATWCADIGDVYGALTTGTRAAEDGSLPGWSGGVFDADAYEASCAAAPDDTSCEVCSGWFFVEYLQPADIAGACDFAYRPTEAQAGALDPDDLAARLSECETTCADYGLEY
jgi:hypothetical protein